MSDKQGKGSYSNEGRVERSTSRADEQGKAGSAYATQKKMDAIKKINESTRSNIKKNL